MKTLTTIFAIFNLFFARIFAPIYMLVLMWFIDWEIIKRPGQGSDDTYLTERGYLPNWCRFAQTVDCPYPGGMYEPTVKNRLEKFGRVWCSYVWSAFRNPMGLSAFLKKDAISQIPDFPKGNSSVEGWSRVGNTWCYERTSDGYWKRIWWFCGMKFERGWEIYKISDSTKYCMLPHFTIRLQKSPFA